MGQAPGAGNIANIAKVSGGDLAMLGGRGATMTAREYRTYMGGRPAGAGRITSNYRRKESRGQGAEGLRGQGAEGAH